MSSEEREEALTTGLIGTAALVVWMMLFPRVEHTETVLVIEKKVEVVKTVEVEHEPTWAPIECIQARYLD